MPRLVDSIRVGDRVTIVDRFGQQHTGRAVMRGPYGWVLNMGGRYGTPGIATDANTVSVRAARTRKTGTDTVTLKCDGWCQQQGDVAMIDRKGYAYCVACGHTRRESGVPCRKLRPAELRRLQRGETLKHY